MEDKKQGEDDAQGFNENELADIMSEIEDLERDLKESETTVKANFEKYKEEKTKVVAPVEKVVPLKNKEATNLSESSMNLEISGQMKVNLHFFISGSEVSLCIDEKDGLVIQMESGAKFVLPMDSLKAKKAA